MDRNPVTVGSLIILGGVALRKESVDRNLVASVLAVSRAWSLSARRAWIEIRNAETLNALACVALRKESVDRNTIVSAVLLMYNVALRKESVDRNLAWHCMSEDVS